MQRKAARLQDEARQISLFAEEEAAAHGKDRKDRKEDSTADQQENRPPAGRGRKRRH